MLQNKGTKSSRRGDRQTPWYAYYCTTADLLHFFSRIPTLFCRIGSEETRRNLHVSVNVDVEILKEDYHFLVVHVNSWSGILAL